MLINKIQDLKGCLKNNQVCRYCIGQTEKFPTSVYCSMGNECGRGECCFHVVDRSRNKLKRIILE